MSKARESIDIVIPVYNGYEDIQLCMKSVKAHTDLTRDYVILINDCSPDERIAGYLDSLQEAHVIVWHNEKNMGFSANVNKGMTYSDRDVILLNADTIVTEGWVEKIQRCAYASDKTGTVTPLSNSATLCSTPIFCQDNPLPDGVTVDEYAALIEQCSLREYPVITVAVGFCMYIKRKVIEEAGLFDAETFQRGYGEENDFCNRAANLGYVHVMCDDTFIYHKGTASFDTAEKLALCEAHDKILRDRYPELMHNNDVYCRDNPHQYIRDNINIYTPLANGRKNLLYLVHLDFATGAFNNVGGVQLHVKDLVGGLRGNYNVFVVARDLEYLRVTAYTAQDTIEMKFPIGPVPEQPQFRRADMADLFRGLIRAFSIDLVHVQHMIDLSLEIFYVAKEFHLPLITTIHDFYYACPTVKLVDDQGVYCPVKKDRDCLHCKAAQHIEAWRAAFTEALQQCDCFIFPSGSVLEEMLRFYPWMQEKSRVIPHGEDYVEQKAEEVVLREEICVSDQMRGRLDQMPKIDNHNNMIDGWAYLRDTDCEDTEIYLEMTDCEQVHHVFPVKKKVRPDVVTAEGQPGALWCGLHLSLFSDTLADGPCRFRILIKKDEICYTDDMWYDGYYWKPKEEKKRLAVAFVGAMTPEKGSETAYTLITSEKEKIDWFSIGIMGKGPIAQLRQENFYALGGYEKEDIFSILNANQIDVVCLLPRWGETFSYTVSEAWMCGIPIIGTDVGAVGARIRETEAGWVVPLDASPEQVLELLHRLQEQPELLEEKKKTAKGLHMQTVAQMCADYGRLYENTMEDARYNEKKAENTARADYGAILQGWEIAHGICGHTRADREKKKLFDENFKLRHLIATMENTRAYRAVRKVTRSGSVLAGLPDRAGTVFVKTLEEVQEENRNLVQAKEKLEQNWTYRLSRKLADCIKKTKR